MDFAEVVVHARDFQPVSVRVHHSVPIDVIDRRTPQNRFLAAGILSDVAADRTGIVGVRINRENPAF